MAATCRMGGCLVGTVKGILGPGAFMNGAFASRTQEQG
jgi:hypothetical protein